MRVSLLTYPFNVKIQYKHAQVNSFHGTSSDSIPTIIIFDINLVSNCLVNCSPEITRVLLWLPSDTTVTSCNQSLAPAFTCHHPSHLIESSFYCFKYVFLCNVIMQVRMLEWLIGVACTVLLYALFTVPLNRSSNKNTCIIHPNNIASAQRNKLLLSLPGAIKGTLQN